MAKGNGAIYGVALLVVMVVIAAYAGAFNPANWPSYTQNPTTANNPCAAYPGTSWDQVTGSCKSSSTPVSGVYHGSVSFIIGTIDGDAKTALTLTAGLYWLMHADNSFAGSAPVIVAATTIPMSPTDNGQMVLVFRYLTCTVGFIDADKSVKNNPSYMKSQMYLKDWDNNGQLDQTYPLDLSSIQLIAGQSLPVISINMIAWTAQTNAVVITNISSPTGMNTAGDYHATGYVNTWTQTDLLKVQRINLAANATVGLGALFAAGSSYIVAFKLAGTGAQTQTVYGRQWLKQDFANPSYDTAQALWDVFKAHSSTGAVDISQTNYGMDYVYERQSGTTWCQYDIWIHTTGDMVAASTYYLTINVVCTNPAGTQWTETLPVTLTG
jgi:hypothetical protein